MSRSEGLVADEEGNQGGVADLESGSEHMS